MCSDKVECEEYYLRFHHKIQNKPDNVLIRLFSQPCVVFLPSLYLVYHKCIAVSNIQISGNIGYFEMDKLNSKCT